LLCLSFENIPFCVCVWEFCGKVEPFLMIQENWLVFR